MFPSWRTPVLWKCAKRGDGTTTDRRKAPEPAVAAAYNFLTHVGIDSTVIKQDRKALKKVLRIDKEQLCGHYAD